MTAILKRYFAAFNAKDVTGMLECLAPDAAPQVNAGGVRHGTDAFNADCEPLTRCNDDTLTDQVHFEAKGRGRAAAEYTVNGTYKASDEGLPEATGQTYVLPAGSFFDITDGKISRVTTRYNLSDWIAQVTGGHGS